MERLSNHYECQSCGEDRLIRGFRKDDPECQLCGSHDLLRLPPQWYNTSGQKDKQGESSKKAIPVYHS